MLNSKENLYFLYKGYDTTLAEIELNAFIESRHLPQSDIEEYYSLLKQYETALKADLLTQLYVYELDGYNSIYRASHDPDFENPLDLKQEIEIHHAKPYRVGIKTLWTGDRKFDIERYDTLEDLKRYYQQGEVE